jgi:hypothetical protein
MDTAELLSAIDSEIARLQDARAILAGQNGRFVLRVTGRVKKHKMSAAARARIGAATKARWAAGKMGKQSQSRSKKLKVAPVKKKHTMSAEGRALLAGGES